MVWEFWNQTSDVSNKRTSWCPILVSLKHVLLSMIHPVLLDDGRPVFSMVYNKSSPQKKLGSISSPLLTYKQPFGGFFSNCWFFFKGAQVAWKRIFEWVSLCQHSCQPTHWLPCTRSVQIAPESGCCIRGIHPGRLTAGTCPHGGLEDHFPFFSWVICRFHVNLPGCNIHIGKEKQHDPFMN